MQEAGLLILEVKCTNSDCGWHGDESRKRKLCLVYYWRGCKPPPRFGSIVLCNQSRATETPRFSGWREHRALLAVGELTQQLSIIIGIKFAHICSTFNYSNFLTCQVSDRKTQTYLAKYFINGYNLRITRFRKRFIKTFSPYTSYFRSF